jgi:DNA modification methylase
MGEIQGAEILVGDACEMLRTLPDESVLAGSPRGGLVLDPFAGSGTTGVVALKHGRDFIGIDLNPKYAEMARARLVGVQTEVPP